MLSERFVTHPYAYAGTKKYLCQIGHGCFHIHNGPCLFVWSKVEAHTVHFDMKNKWERVAQDRFGDYWRVEKTSRGEKFTTRIGRPKRRLSDLCEKCGAYKDRLEGCSEPVHLKCLNYSYGITLRRLRNLLYEANSPISRENADYLMKLACDEVHKAPKIDGIRTT